MREEGSGTRESSFYCEKLMQIVVKYEYDKWLLLEKNWCSGFLVFCMENNIYR